MFSFNGEHANKYFDKVLSIRRATSAPISLNTLKINGKVGQYFFGKEVDAYTIEARCYLKGAENADQNKFQELWSKIRKINGWLLQDQLCEFRLDDEPNLYYKSIVNEQIDLEEIIEMGFATIRFYIPDGYAYGETKNQRVSSAGLTFTRQGIRYREDGTEVTENFPVYKPGKIKESILIEEGTSNLLKSSNSPVREELTVKKDSEYYLTNIEGTAKIEHENVISIPAEKQTLTKEGIDVSGSVDTSWNNPDIGAHNGTESPDGNSIVLAKSGQDFNRKDLKGTDFEGGTFTNTKTTYEILEDFEDTQYKYEFVTPSGSDEGWGRITNKSFHGTGCFASNLMTPVPATHKFAVTEFKVTIPLGATNGRISMMYMVSSEQDYDFFRIKINNVVRLVDSGQKPWKKFSLGLAPGTYTVRLEYDIDGRTSLGDNRCYVDDILVSYDSPSDDASLSLSDLPDYDFKDDLTNYLTNWTGNFTYGVTQNSGFITITSETGKQCGIDRINVVSFPFTLDFYGKFDGNSDLYVSDGVKIFLVTIPNTNGQNSWFRIRCLNNSSPAFFYKDGVLQGEIDPADYAHNRITISYFGYTKPSGYTSEVSCVYYSYKDLGEPTSSYSGSYTSKQYDVDQVGNVVNSIVSWVEKLERSYTDIHPTVNLETRLVDYSGGSPVYGDWVAVSNGGPIGVVSKGDNTTNKKFQYRVSIETTDPGLDVLVSDIDLFIESAYNTTGYYESEPVDVSQVGKASESIFTLLGNTPIETSYTIETSVSTDGGNTFLPYKVITSGSPIEDISQSTDLSLGRFKYKITLNTDDVSVSPSVQKIEYSLKSGYKPSQTFNLDPYPVSGIGVVSDSYLTWYSNTPGSTSIHFESSMDNITWTSVQNEGKLIPDSTDLTGKQLYLRYKLSTSDTCCTPTLGNIVTWRIAQAEPNLITPATNKLVLIPIGVFRWQLENKSYGTGWQMYGTSRNPETLKLYMGTINEPRQGTIEFWGYDKGETRGYSKRYLFESDSTINSCSLSKLGDSGNYQLKVSDQVFPEINSPEMGWNYFVLTWNGPNLKFYINGEEKISHIFVQDVSFGDIKYLFLGSDITSKNQWNSLIDELAIHTVEQPIEYIQERFTSVEPIVGTPTSSIYHFDGNLYSDGDKDVVVEGTAPTFPIVQVTFTEMSSHFQVSNGVDFVRVTRNFEPNDILIIDCEKNMCTLNNSQSLAMPYVDLESDFFSIETGQEIEVDPLGSGIVDVSFVERWK